MFQARTFLDELGRIEPAILAAATAALGKASEDLGFVRLDRTAFASAPNLSVDCAVMERTSNAAMLTIDVGWTDVGSWSSLWEIAPRDADGNYVNGEAVLEESRNCYIHSEKALVSTIGVTDLVIIDTPDAILVADQQLFERELDLARTRGDEMRALAQLYRALGGGWQPEPPTAPPPTTP